MNKLNQTQQISQPNSNNNANNFILQIIQRCPKAFKKVLALLFKMLKKYDLVNASQQWFADITDYSRQWVNHILLYLERIGLITIEHGGKYIAPVYVKGIMVFPGGYTTNSYHFSASCSSIDFHYFLAAILPGCQALHYSLLMSMDKCIYTEKLTLLRPSYEYNSNETEECKVVVDCKEAKMETNRSEMVRSLESLKNTPLSEADIKAIVAYPDEVISYANRQTNQKGALANPIGYFLVCCREFNKKHLANVQNHSSRLETRNEIPQKGMMKPASSSKSPMNSQEAQDNKDRIDRISKERLLKSQLTAWKRMMEDQNTPQLLKDDLQRMINALAYRKTISS